VNQAHDVVYPIQHYVIKFVSDLWQVGDFLEKMKRKIFRNKKEGKPK
jgi:hypothetical protein